MIFCLLSAFTNECKVILITKACQALNIQSTTFFVSGALGIGTMQMVLMQQVYWSLTCVIAPKRDQVKD